jgi:hypothetical protein
MSYVLIDETNLIDIGDAIREQIGNKTKYYPSEMGDAIRAIPSGTVDSALTKAIIEGAKDRFDAVTALPEGITRIRGDIFSDSNIRVTKLPDTVTVLEDRAFSECLYLQLTELPSNLVEIGNYCFGLATIGGGIRITSIPDSVTYIGSSAFLNCDNMTITKLPESLEYLGADAFGGCDNIYISEIPAGVKFLFEGCLRTNRSSVVTFKGTPMSIASDAFRDRVGTVGVTEIRVPWAEGEVPRAPWGATNATITYNYKS